MGGPSTRPAFGRLYPGLCAHVCVVCMFERRLVAQFLLFVTWQGKPHADTHSVALFVRFVRVYVCVCVCVSAYFFVRKAPRAEF